MFETPSVMYQLGERSGVFGDDMNRAVSKLEGVIDQIGAHDFTPPLSRVGDGVKKQGMVPLQLVTKKCYSCKCHLLIRSRKNTKKHCGMCGSDITTPYLRRELKYIPPVRPELLIDEEDDEFELNMTEIDEAEPDVAEISEPNRSNAYNEFKLSVKESMQNQLGIEVVNQFMMVFSVLLDNGKRKVVGRLRGPLPDPIIPSKYNKKEED